MPIAPDVVLYQFHDIFHRAHDKIGSPAPAADFREATVLLYAHTLAPHLEKMPQLADRVFCVYEMPRAAAKSRSKAEIKMSGL